ncbi:complement factor I [Rhinatrema bivittatum]|uniref:complement factor I n=1 Tax=Rhinatrema bivittatum TaxID=194408 RepID=UPI00112D504D|nr:complement factor I [Rhinatrema bivittatum]
MEAISLLCILLCFIFDASGLNDQGSESNQAAAQQSLVNKRLNKECLQKHFTDKSCLKAFCHPWQRCFEGICACKLPYQCPKNSTSTVCSATGREFRSYCQQKSYECLNPRETFSSLGKNCKIAEKFKISLTYGENESEGIIQIKLLGSRNESFLCSNKWSITEANVVCRQLGFEKGAHPSFAEKKFNIPQSDLETPRCLQVTCRGSETSLAECGFTESSHSSPAGIRCYTESTDCANNEFKCVNGKCIAEESACDGINDCGDQSDELCCTECSNSFHCSSDICIPNQYRCNQEIDCINGDDEAGCGDVRREDSLSKSEGTEEQNKVIQKSMDNERKFIKSILPSVYCGITNSSRTRRKRIVGGTHATKDEFPWQVAIKDGENVNCGGIYIGGCWVLTAAHCVRANRPQQYRIMVGLLDRKHYENVDSFPVKRVIIHEHYDASTYLNDIALLEVENIYKEDLCMQSGNNLVPACIPWSEYLFKAGDRCKVSGWGREEGFAKVFFLKWGYIYLMSNCSKTYKERFFDVMECAGTYDGSIDSCKGDSGGPLVCYDSHNVAYVWGIVSWGENCGLEGYPGVYTKVAKFFEWISYYVGRSLVTRYNA